jgi:hypothetical protein
MNLPSSDFNAINLRWTDRINRENKVNTRSRSSGYEARGEVDIVCQKISAIPAPRERKERVLEFMRLKEAAAPISQDFTFQVSSPRHKFLIPQVRLS